MTIAEQRPPRPLGADVVPRVGGGRVPDAPRYGARAHVAAAVVRRVAHHVPVQIVLAGGRTVGTGGADAPTMLVHAPAAMFARLARNPKLGFGESYMAGEWSAAPGTDLAELLVPFAARLESMVPRAARALRSFVDGRIPATDRNTRSGARRNISRHYDLSNEMFATFLDDTMTYSSAWFPDDLSASGARDLTAAQTRKVDGILDMARVGPGSRVAEIGTGWGFLAVRAAQRGATVTTVTLSEQQLEVARRRAQEHGVADRVDARLQDYRELTGSYDAVVSVEMIEAVGPALWRSYFTKLGELLAPGGRIGLQAITMPHRQMLATRRSYGWIQKYVFPGGLIPSMRVIEDCVSRFTNLYIAERRELGPHYAETLRQWRERFLARWDDVAALGFDDAFRRLWELYLAYSEAGFRAGYLGVSQLSIASPPTR